MSEMVERVAKAIWSVPMCGIEDARGSDDEIIVAMARAAIEAMREPTRPMYEAANDALVPTWDAKACWHSMIDAALNKAT